MLHCHYLLYVAVWHLRLLVPLQSGPCAVYPQSLARQAFKQCLLNRIKVIGQAGLISASFVSGKTFSQKFLYLKFILPFPRYSGKYILYYIILYSLLFFSFLFFLSCNLLGNKMPDLILFSIQDMVENLTRDKKLPLAKRKFISCLKISFVMIFFIRD